MNTQNFNQSPPLYPGHPFYRNQINGRAINFAEEVTPNEVPMDGSVGLFYLRDFSAIYAKSWLPNGTIKTVKYVPEVVTEPPVSTEQQDQSSEKDKFELYYEDFMAALNRIENAVTERKVEG